MYKQLQSVFPNWDSNGGLFVLMKEKNLPWESNSYELLDVMYFGANSSQKLISPLVEHYLLDDVITTEGKQKITDILLLRYKTKWIKLFNTMGLEYSPIENYNMNETSTLKTVGTSESNNQNKSIKTNTYGYNSETPTPQDDISETVGQSTDLTNTNTLNRHGNIGVTTSQQMIQAERDLWYWDYFKIVFKDVDSLLTLNIY